MVTNVISHFGESSYKTSGSFTKKNCANIHIKKNRGTLYMAPLSLRVTISDANMFYIAQFP